MTTAAQSSEASPTTSTASIKDTVTAALATTTVAASCRIMQILCLISLYLPIIAACEKFTSCDTCVGNSNCGWCGVSATCMLGTSFGAESGKCDLASGGAWYWDDADCSLQLAFVKHEMMSFSVLGRVASKRWMLHMHDNLGFRVRLVQRRQ